MRQQNFVRASHRMLIKKMRDYGIHSSNRLIISSKEGAFGKGGNKRCH